MGLGQLGFQLWPKKISEPLKVNIKTYFRTPGLSILNFWPTLSPEYPKESLFWRCQPIPPYSILKTSLLWCVGCIIYWWSCARHADIQMRVKNRLFSGLKLGYRYFLDFCFGGQFSDISRSFFSKWCWHSAILNETAM